MFFILLNTGYANTQVNWTDTTGVSTSVADDSLSALVDSNLNKTKSRNLYTLYSKVADRLINNNDTITQGEYQFEEYRSFSNILLNHYSSYEDNFGLFGHPDFISLLGNNHVSFLDDELSINSPWKSQLNLFNLSIPKYSHISVSTLARGFLFGHSINGVTVNFRSKYLLPVKPITQLLYFQGQNEEGELNLLFARRIISDVYFSLNLANKAITSNYKNSDYSNWNGHFNLKYLFSNKLNFSLDYSYLRTVTGLNGGVDFDSIKSGNFGNDYNSILYNNYLAPVLFPERYSKNRGQSTKLTMLAAPQNNLMFKASIYHNQNLYEFRQNEKGKTYSRPINKIVENYYYNSWGINAFANFTTPIFETSVISTYEYKKINSPLITQKPESYFSISEMLSTNFFGASLKPTIFHRALVTDNKIFNGIGADIVWNITKKIQFYGGGSYYEKPFSLFESQFITTSQSNVANLQVELDYRSEELQIKLTNFYSKTANEPIAYSRKSVNQYYYPSVIGFTNGDKNVSGINIYAKYNFYKFNFFINGTYQKITELNSNITPKIISNSGFYYTDSLFTGNLFLKAGVNLFFTGKQNFLFYDIRTATPVRFYLNNNGNYFIPLPYQGSNDAFTADLFITGRIQDRATFYFIFENLMDKKYFVIPFYPKQSRGIRFGVYWDLYN